MNDRSDSFRGRSGRSSSYSRRDDRGAGGRSRSGFRPDRSRDACGSDRPRPAPYPERPRPSLGELFRTDKPVIGVVHLKPLPGSPGYEGHFLDILNFALDDARAIEEGGATGLIVENFGDAPFYPDRAPVETIACLTRLVTEIRKIVRIPVGVNVLRNDAVGGVAVAAATGAGFVRVNVHTGAVVADQGIITGRAYESIRLRETLRSRTLLFSDIRVKHARPLVEFDLLNEAFDAVKRGKSDALIVTGPATGRSADIDDVRRLKEAMPEVPVLVGSGVSPENMEEVLSIADGCIVGTAIKEMGEIHRPVDVERVRRFAEVAERLSPRRRREPREWDGAPRGRDGEFPDRDAAPRERASAPGVQDAEPRPSSDAGPAPVQPRRVEAPAPPPESPPIQFGRSPVRKKRR